MVGTTNILVLMLGTAATAELPPPRPPAAPFPAEPPTAEMVLCVLRVVLRVLLARDRI